MLDFQMGNNGKLSQQRSQMAASGFRFRACLAVATGLVAFVHGLSPVVQASGEGAPRPNIVLILADYMGYGDIGPYGVPDIETPNLDRLAREGVRLTQFYAAAPICTPSRVALLTGRYPQRIGLENNARADDPSTGLPVTEPTLGRMLKDEGYKTAVFGKWHLGYETRFGPIAHGFDEFFGIKDWTVDYYSHRTYTGEAGLFEGTEAVEETGYLTDLLTERAVSFVERNAHQSFFLYLSYLGGLPPCQPPGQPWDIRDQETWDSSTRADYIRVVESMDSGIGRVLEALDAGGLSQRTLVIFSYDHGGRELSRKLPFFHGFATLWEGGLRVPCLLRWPGVLPAGSTSEQMAIHMDLTATILSAAETSPGRPLDGIDLLPILKGELVPQERQFFWRLNIRGRQQAVTRRGRWKFMRDGITQLLFDVEADPGERADLVYESPDVATRLRKSLEDWDRSLPVPR